MSGSEFRFVKTGVPGLDELLEGQGIPEGYHVFLLGSPGSGKTTLALQFLHYGASIGENGIYISLDEAPHILIRNMRRVGIDLESDIKSKRLALIDASPIRHIPGTVKIGAFAIGKRDFSLASLIDAIQNHARELHAKRLVIDPISSFLLQYPDEAERRTAVMDLMEGVATLGCTTLYLSELVETGTDRRYQFEEYLAQGVIIMRRVLKPTGIVNSIQVEKMRGVAHDVQPHPYRITQNGIEVYPTELVF